MELRVLAIHCICYFYCSIHSIGVIYTKLPSDFPPYHACSCNALDPDISWFHVSNEVFPPSGYQVGAMAVNCNTIGFWHYVVMHLLLQMVWSHAYDSLQWIWVLAMFHPYPHSVLAPTVASVAWSFSLWQLIDCVSHACCVVVLLPSGWYIVHK